MTTSDDIDTLKEENIRSYKQIDALLKKVGAGRVLIQDGKVLIETGQVLIQTLDEKVAHLREINKKLREENIIFLELTDEVLKQLEKVIEKGSDNEKEMIKTRRQWDRFRSLKT